MICRTLRLLTCLAFAAQASHADSLPERPRAVLNQQLVPDSAVTVVVRDVASGESLVELNAATPRQPASTMKLVPTWAALELLGPAYSWKTRAWSDAPVVKGILKGNLYLQGGGDPLLTIERWWRFVSDLRQTGLRVIEGAYEAWGIVIVGHIYRVALERSLLLGVLLSFACEIMVVSAIQSLFPVPL